MPQSKSLLWCVCNKLVWGYPGKMRIRSLRRAFSGYPEKNLDQTCQVVAFKNSGFCKAFITFYKQPHPQFTLNAIMNQFTLSMSM
jgi:hypothetical protein